MTSAPRKAPENMEGELCFFEAGAKLVTENELSRKMFIIKKGKVRVWKNYVGQKVTLAILGEGEVFGELSFFDAAPRSASVEALTDVEAIVIDGKRATEQIAGLPSWVIPIFKTVFHRFREADQKITVLQSMNEFQKKALNTDAVGKSIYMELLRFIKTLELLYSRSHKIDGVVKRDSLLKELDDVLGKRAIGLNVFWKLLKEHDFMDLTREELSGEVVLRTDALEQWRQELCREIESERFLLVSFSGMAILRRMVSSLVDDTKNDPMPGNRNFSFLPEDLKLANMPLFEEGMEELVRCKILRKEGAHYKMDPAYVMETYHYQSLLKFFDHTTISLD
ncbi:MAG: cyclic nucleotide-binding domain-containing protein [Bdellovibrionales bacterium]|nr:cyclic nucleotide-binding domain-containing protein [Bdellovibrionales bacterium]